MDYTQLIERAKCVMSELDGPYLNRRQQALRAALAELVGAIETLPARLPGLEKSNAALDTESSRLAQQIADVKGVAVRS